MIKSIKKFPYEKRSKTLGLLTMKKGMLNLQRVMKYKVMSNDTHTKGEATKLERVNWKNKYFSIQFQLDSETEVSLRSRKE